MGFGRIGDNMIEQNGMIADVVNLKAIHDKMQDFFQEYQHQIAAITDAMKSKRYTPEQLVDLGFLCREMESLCDEWRKESKARKELAGKLIAFVVMSTDGTEITVQGQLATGTPNLKMQADLPKKGSEEYELLCHGLGVNGMGLTKLDWKEVQVMINERAELGAPMPAGIGEQRAMYSTVFRRKR